MSLSKTHSTTGFDQFKYFMFIFILGKTRNPIDWLPSGRNTITGKKRLKKRSEINYSMFIEMFRVVLSTALMYLVAEIR